MKVESVKGRQHWRWIPVWLLVAGLSCNAGCGARGPAPMEADVGAENLSAVATAYLRYVEQHKRPPQSEDELQDSLGELSSPDFLVSTRDGKPFVILWGTDPAGGMTETPLVIGYEEDGKNGGRFVFTAMGVMFMDEEGFSQANFPPGHRPAPAVD